MAELKSGEDVAFIFKDANSLEDNLNRQTIKEALESIGKNDLARKLEIKIAASNGLS